MLSSFLVVFVNVVNRAGGGGRTNRGREVVADIVVV